MPFYSECLDRMNQTERKRVTQRLLALRARLDKKIPQKDTDSSLILATWNIRDFDTESYGWRLDESILYMAEIINRFDLVAIQELKGNLGGLRRLRRVLGSDWHHLYSDVTDGRRGNDERMAFLYDTRKVTFGGLAGELVLPPLEKKVGGKTVYEPVAQVVRTPFMAGFRAGWQSFILTTVHVLYGSRDAEPPERVREIQQVADMLGRRARQRNTWSENLVLLGDFNIFSRSDATYQAITNAGFTIPPPLQSIPGSNVAKDKLYDQIAFKARSDFQVADPNKPSGCAGVFDFYDTVFVADEADQLTYKKYMGDAYEVNSKGKPRPETGTGSKRSYYQTYWRTQQMSDHLPMWVKLSIDSSEMYLKRRGTT